MIEKITFAPTQFLDEAAGLIVSRHRLALPNLSSLQIIIASRAANNLRHAFATAAAKLSVPALMLPRIATLNVLAAEQTRVADRRIATTGERVLELFQVLKKQRWFSAGETLALSRELVQLADELTNNLVTLPQSLAEHARNLARAYTLNKQNGDFNFEARLTYDVWQQLAQPSVGSIDAATSYALQLASWAADKNRQPLYVIGSAHFSKRELAFFFGYGDVVFIDQQHQIAQNARADFIAAAFAGAPGGHAVPILVPDYSYPVPTSTTINIECYAALDVEDEAGAALATIKRWLAGGKREIAVVALDRLAARRLRALAEREQILMTDEIGWPYSTTVSATAIMAWLEAKRDGFYFETLIDLAKSPFIFADLNETWGRERIKSAVLVIERAIRRAGVVAGLTRVREAVMYMSVLGDGNLRPINTDDALQLLDRMIVADRSFTNARRSAVAWIDALLESLCTLGIDSGLQRDAAGAGLLGHLHQAKIEMADSNIKLSVGEWTDWLRTLMEEVRFRDVTIDSPIVMTSLDATRYRHFDAVMLLGASAGNLPGKPVSTGIFNQSVRRTLGLKTFADDLPQITNDLIGVLNRSQACWLSWQRQTGNEPENPSPWVAALKLAAKRNGFNLSAQKLTAKRRSDLAVSDIKASRPAPVLEFGHIPPKITASGYQSLIDCPYQYFSRAVLKLREPDDVQEEMEKRDFGEFVHDILHRFHYRYPLISGIDVATLTAALIAETAAVFAAALQQNFMARAWRLQWESAIGRYLAWQLVRESAGWRWRDGEVKAGFTIELDNGDGQQFSIKLEGRIDRIDDKLDADESAVIDYKTRAFGALSKKLKEPGEDVQLPVYVALVEALTPERKIIEASYLSIERQGVKPAYYPAAEASGQDHVLRLQTLFGAMVAGAALPAQGIDSVCQYCEMRGLCRRDYWLDAGQNVATNEDA